jgi:hypothetical protein
MHNNIINNENSDESYIFTYSDDDDDNNNINLEITDYNNGNLMTQNCNVKYKNNINNEKRLLCFSILNEQKCVYGEKCTYAHNLIEQFIDIDKEFLYKIILDRNLMNFYSLTNPKTDEIYRNLLLLTKQKQILLNF